MENLIKSLDFLACSAGVCIIVLTICYIFTKLYQVLIDVSTEDKKKIIYDTIHEYKKDAHIRRL